MNQKNNKHIPLIHAVDLFCGVGGLTKGFERSGIKAIMGIDIDHACQYPYSTNNDSKFVLKSVNDVTGDEIKSAFSGSKYSLLAGCAPCQPFSTYSQGRPKDERWGLIKQFQRLVSESKPDIVSMENVPRLKNTPIFRDFVSALEKLDYHVSYKVICCSDFGVPQHRQRLVLLASRLGEIQIPCPRSNQKKKTVREAIGHLKPLKAGEQNFSDKLHFTSALSELNMRRIRASKPGGTWRDWPNDLIAACHKKEKGKRYVSVYGRMEWDEVSPAITTQFYGFGNGRFGHPSQDRAISLREGAILQSFPKSYKFVKAKEPVPFTSLGRLIGNAVPVKLAETLGRTIVKHAHSFGK